MEIKTASLKAIKALIDSTLPELEAKLDLARQIWLENEDQTLNDGLYKVYKKINARFDCLSDISDRIQDYLYKLEEIDTL